MRRLLSVLVAAVVLTAVGFLGAGAFNPDTGTVAQIEWLYSVFGIGAYLGMLAIVLTMVYVLGAGAVLAARSLAGHLHR